MFDTIGRLKWKILFLERCVFFCIIDVSNMV